VVAGIEAALGQLVVVGLGLGAEAEETHEDALPAGLLPVGDEIGGMLGRSKSR
jgi:hypothetical protein